MLSKGVHDAPIEWVCRGTKVIKAPFETKVGIIINVIQSYSPKNDNNDDDWEKGARLVTDFYIYVHSTTWLQAV